MMLTVSQVAERLQLSESAVYAMIRSGELISHRVGTGRGRHRISEESLCEYLDRRRSESAGKPATPPPRPKLKHIRV